ncbi:hypothetical protein [Sphingobium subterraneum]|uniref:Uncharacterized protein n=1 Tax=Sphingobium subterraneum TaxID=627688 RepID=A0A841J662_9SPHN|nr:hypothetical protein [Sphingobium subterraneum]MBB6123701.1 hypothetical protein [Sphingobium subterraneum]
MRRSALTCAQALGRAIANLLQTRPADAAEQLRLLLQGAEAWVPVGHGMMFQADTLLILAFRPEFPSSTVGEPMTAITDAAMLASRLDAADPSERNRALASFSIPRDARLRILQREGAANWRLAIATFSSKQKRYCSGITNDKHGWIIKNIE